MSDKRRAESVARDALIATAFVWAREARDWSEKGGLKVLDYLADWDRPLYRAIKRYEKATKQRRKP